MIPFVKLTVGEMRRSVGPDLFEPLTTAGDAELVRSVALLEELGKLEELGDGTFAVLGARAADEAGGYRMELALRRAAERGLVALAVPGDSKVQLTTLALAERGGISLLRIAGGHDVGSVVLALSRALEAGAGSVLARIGRTLAVLDGLRDEPPADAQGVVETLSPLTTGLGLREPEADDLTAPVRVDGVAEVHLCAERQGVTEDVATQVLLSLGAATIERLWTEARRAEEAPIRSTSELLTELLAADPGRSASLLNRARTLGVPVDGWHVVARLEVDQAAGREDDAAAFVLQEMLGTLALRTVRASGGTWHVARSESATILVRMYETDPGPGAIRSTARAVDRAVAEVARHLADRTVRAGLGSVHAGAMGVRVSAAEARAALGAARVAGRAEPVTSYDLVGLQRMLLEWYASDTARESVEMLLAPLERLGPRRAETAIRTLQAFLDEQGSVTRAARTLFLHRNAVTYRIKRISDLLGVDLKDADQRLALQLACRARLLPAPRSVVVHPASTP